ncbi:bro [Trichoplusia ni granulovirus LBIV-12]|uniref:Bro n=1 Tax=Trichoplusia ni granulovirus LBIV-12 TaxID=1916701 RepID=A0A1D8QLH4_GVTN|nr:bro [Trichoplusia ni granulovirus LBIV-12]AOW41486.1 bro [Trichoplusia ni granulovirus LBIV-12]
MTLVKKSCNIGGVSAEIWIVELEKDKYMYGGHGVAEFLGYKNTRDAIHKHVKPQWKATWETVANRDPLMTSLDQDNIPVNWQPNTVFISEAGVYALIMRSKLPAAEEFQRWLFEEVLPEIRNTGKYAHKEKDFNVVNYDKKLADAQIEALQLKLDLSVAKHNHDIAMSEMQRNYERQIAEYKEREYKLQMILKDLSVKANMTMMQFGVSTLLAQDNIKQNEEMRASISAASDRLVPSIANRPEKEHYVTCYDRTVNGRKRIRVTRTQYAEVEQCDKMVEQFKKNPAKKFRSKRYGWLKDSEKFLQIKCPNPVTLWVAIKDLYPHICYGFNFVNQIKTEIEFMDEDELRQKYRNDVLMCERNLKKDADEIARFKKLGLKNEQDAVDKCLTSSLDAKDKVGKIIEKMIEDTQSEMTPKQPQMTFRNASEKYTHEQVAGCIHNFLATNSFNNYFINYNYLPPNTVPAIDDKNV